MANFHNVPQVLAENIYFSVIVYNVTYTFFRSNLFIVICKSSVFLLSCYLFNPLVTTDVSKSLNVIEVL